MDRACEDRGSTSSWAGTRGCSAPRVTSGCRWPKPATTMGEMEGGKWFREKNGRRVMTTRDGKYWRAPRPHPRLNRRRQRRRGEQILQHALDGVPPSQTSDTTEAILVLQRALRNAHDRFQKMVEATTAELEKKRRKLQKATAKIDELTEQVDVALEDLCELQLTKAQTAAEMHHHQQELQEELQTQH